MYQCQPLNLMLTFPRCLRILNWWQPSDTTLICITNYKTCHTLKILSVCRLFLHISNYRKRRWWWWWLRATCHTDTPYTIVHCFWRKTGMRERGQRLHENINGIGKCKANSSYVDDHVIRITNHIIRWRECMLRSSTRYIKRYADDSPACLTQYKSRFDAKCVCVYVIFFVVGRLVGWLVWKQIIKQNGNGWKKI